MTEYMMIMTKFMMIMTEYMMIMTKYMIIMTEYMIIMTEWLEMEHPLSQPQKVMKVFHFSIEIGFYILS